MKHAGERALARLAPLLAALRTWGLREPKPGTFYRGSVAFLHFHEDAAGDFADLKVDGDWQRLRVVTQRERAQLQVRVRRVLRRLSRDPAASRRASRSPRSGTIAPPVPRRRPNPASCRARRRPSR
jgi:hypothetical protein